MFKHDCRKCISLFDHAFLQCKILLLSHVTKSMNLDTMPCVGIKVQVRASCVVLLLCYSAFASLDQKSPVASSHFHSSISSISSTKESHNHSSKVRFKPASMIFFRHILMSHASLGMQQQLLCQYCHGQSAFLTCMCFREYKESACC